MARDGVCGLCSSPRRLTAAHIRPRDNTVADPQLPQPADRLENLMSLCGSCHSRYEAAVRGDRYPPIRYRVELLGAALLKSRGVA